MLKRYLENWREENAWTIPVRRREALKRAKTVAGRESG